MIFDFLAQSSVYLALLTVFAILVYSLIQKGWNIGGLLAALLTLSYVVSPLSFIYAETINKITLVNPDIRTSNLSTMPVLHTPAAIALSSSFILLFIISYKYWTFAPVTAVKPRYIAGNPNLPAYRIWGYAAAAVSLVATYLFYQSFGGYAAFVEAGRAIRSGYGELYRAGSFVALGRFTQVLFFLSMAVWVFPKKILLDWIVMFLLPGAVYIHYSLGSYGRGRLVVWPCPLFVDSVFSR